MSFSQKGLAAIAVMLLVVTVVSAGLLIQVRIPAVGRIKSVGLEVYSDANCSVRLTEVNWGFVSHGEVKIVHCYLKSTSTVNASLSLNCSNWMPSSAASFMMVSWNREGALIKPDEVVFAAFTLNVSSAVTGIDGFSFDLVITAVEA